MEQLLSGTLFPLMKEGGERHSPFDHHFSRGRFSARHAISADRSIVQLNFPVSSIVIEPRSPFITLLSQMYVPPSAVYPLFSMVFDTLLRARKQLSNKRKTDSEKIRGAINNLTYLTIHGG